MRILFLRSFMHKKLIKLLFLLGVIVFFEAVIYEPYSIKITSYNLKNPQLSGLKIIFATDFHVASYPWEKWRLERIVNTINEHNPDIVILGGDYVNRHYKTGSMSPNDIATALKQIKAPKVAVLGNHDTYYGKKEVSTAFKNALIPVLDNRSTKLNLRDKEVYIAGVSDYDTDKPNIKKALENTKTPLIFATHSPDTFMQLNNDVAIAFAGHTHGGQIVLPFLGALVTNTESGRKYTYGLSYKNKIPLITSSGLGTSVLPIRFNNKPEIVSVNFQ